MPRIARVVCPEVPHHITQRGVRRFNVFLDEADHLFYLKLLEHYAPRFGLGIVSYCTMTNHVHIVGVPEREDSIAKVFRDCHGTYASDFNKKYGNVGHVWQARPYSCVLDEAHTWAAIRYVERNPVRAQMVQRAEDYRWSSARAHCGMSSDTLLKPDWQKPQWIGNWSEWLTDSSDTEMEQRVRARTHTGRPCGNDMFVRSIERVLGRHLAPMKSGPKPKPEVANDSPTEREFPTK